MFHMFQSEPSVENNHSERVSASDRYNTSSDTYVYIGDAVQVLLLVKDTP